MSQKPHQNPMLAALMDMIAACWTILTAYIASLIHSAQNKAHGRGEVITLYTDDSPPKASTGERRP